MALTPDATGQVPPEIANAIARKREAMLAERAKQMRNQNRRKVDVLGEPPPENIHPEPAAILPLPDPRDFRTRLVAQGTQWRVAVLHMAWVKPQKSEPPLAPGQGLLLVDAKVGNAGKQTARFDVRTDVRVRVEGQDRELLPEGWRVCEASVPQEWEAHGLEEVKHLDGTPVEAAPQVPGGEVVGMLLSMSPVFRVPRNAKCTLVVGSAAAR